MRPLRKSRQLDDSLRHRERALLSGSITLLLASPTAALSVLIVVVIEMCMGPWLFAIATGLWLLAGVTLFDLGWFTPNRAALAKIFGFRRPISPETEILTTAWTNVTSAPGVDGWPYSLWVEQSSFLNAYAAPTRIVAVTSWAVASLEPRQLEAVLAHELGHQLHTDQRLRLLAAWSSIPTTVVQRLAGGPALLMNAVGIRGNSEILVRFALTTAALASLPFLLASTTGVPVALSLSALFIIEPLARAALRRREEFAADQTAVDLGYRQDYAAALHRLALDDLPPTGLLTLRNRWWSSHPPFTARLRALDR
ncbi:M48 family metalloprotease [Nocardia sp. NBC_01327]|uniref:M48 family metalloprotease n=1 Tax=Nocardia sp. NBC_01327 TaxID=2903593 RepID=UPI002E137536|nr:M48 family metalloprotease [Nocardia sp. NBC_01327]